MPSCLYLTDPYTDSSKEVEIDLSSTLGQFKDVVAQHTGIAPQEQGKWCVTMENVLGNRKVLHHRSKVSHVLGWKMKKYQLWKVTNKNTGIACWFCRRSFLSKTIDGFYPVILWAIQIWHHLRRGVGDLWKCGNVLQLPDGGGIWGSVSTRLFQCHLPR